MRRFGSGTSTVVCILCVVYLRGAALAHDTVDYFGGPPWADLSVEYHRNLSDTWNNSWITSLNTADATWSNISTSDGFTFAQQSTELAGGPCGIGPSTISTVNRGSYGDGSAGVFAYVARCNFGTSNEKFYMFIDSDSNWYPSLRTTSTSSFLSTRSS